MDDYPLTTTGDDSALQPQLRRLSLRLSNARRSRHHQQNHRPSEADPDVTEPHLLVGDEPQFGQREPSLFSNILAPNLGISADILTQQRGALRRIEVNDSYAKGAQPLHAALKIAALSDDQRTEAKLTDQSTAVPARRKRGNHGQVSIAALASRMAEGIGLAVHGRVVVLYSTVMTRADEFAHGIKDRSSDRDASFGQPFMSFRQCHRQHCRMIKLKHDRDYIEDAR